MSIPLDDAWLSLKAPPASTHRFAAPEHTTPGNRSGGVSVMGGPGGGVFLGNEYQTMLGGNQPQRGQRRGIGSRLGAFMADRGSRLTGRGGWMGQRTGGHWGSPVEGMGMAARGLGTMADLGSRVASLPFAALGFNEGQQSGSFGGALDATLAGYGKGRALTNMGANVMNRVANTAGDIQSGADAQYAANAKAALANAPPPPSPTPPTPSQQIVHPAQIRQPLPISSSSQIPITTPTQLRQPLPLDPNTGGLPPIPASQIPVPGSSRQIDAGYGASHDSAAATDAAEAEDEENADMDPAPLPPMGTSPSPHVIPEGMGNIRGVGDLQMSEPMDLSWRLLKQSQMMAGEGVTCPQCGSPYVEPFLFHQQCLRCGHRWSR